MGKIILITITVLAVVYLLVRLLVEIPVDCMPTIGPKPFYEELVKLFFKTKCVTF